MILELIVYFFLIVVLLYLYIILLTFLGKTFFFFLKHIKKYISEIKIVQTYQDKYIEKPEEFMYFKIAIKNYFKKLFGKRVVFTKIDIKSLRQEYATVIKTNPFLLHSKENRYYWVLFLVGNILAWQYFRYTDIENTQFKHTKAREYYALSHQLLSYDMGLIILFRNPDSILLKPLNLLQDALIESAQEYLPKDDGEIAMYHYQFKLYPYMVTHYDPSLSDAKKVQALTYKVLEEFSTLPIQDQEVREYSRYRLYPMAAEYFLFIARMDYKDHAKIHGHRKYRERMLTNYFKDAYKMKQLEDIGRWSVMHYETLQKYPRIDQFIKENPLIDAMYLATITLPLEGVLQSKLFNLTYRCDDALVPLAYKYINTFYNRYYALTDKRYWGYSNAIITQAEALLGAFHSLCGYELIGKDKLLYDGWPVREFLFYPQESKDENPNDHLKWWYRVAELEKIILKTNFREQALECSRHEWHFPKYSSIQTSYNYDNYKDNPKAQESLRKEAQKNLQIKLQELEDIKEEYTQCLIDRGLIQPDKEKYLQCYSKEWMWHKKHNIEFNQLPRTEQIQYRDAIEKTYQQCLIDNNLIKLTQEQ